MPSRSALSCYWLPAAFGSSSAHHLDPTEPLNEAGIPKLRGHPGILLLDAHLLRKIPRLALERILCGRR